ncbi:MAG: GYD domain-containing protein [Acidimicrobiia bacterium]|nr:GYD domain-containing protein [Acidimicrobiia bacterium]
MTKFVILINYPGDEIEQIKDLPERLASGREGSGGEGVTIESYYLTFGRFDAIAIIDAPDGPTAAKFILKMIGVGNVRTETMTAFGEEQIDAIADGLLD